MMSKLIISALFVFVAIANKAYALHETFHIMNPVQITDNTGIPFFDTSNAIVELHMNGMLPDTYEFNGQYSHWYLTDAHVDLTPTFLLTPQKVYTSTDFLTWNIYGDGQNTVSLNVNDIILEFTSFSLEVHAWEFFPGGETVESEPYHNGGYLPSSYSLTMSNDLASMTVSTVPLPPALYLFLSSIGLVFVKKRIIPLTEGSPQKAY